MTARAMSVAIRFMVVSRGSPRPGERDMGGRVTQRVSSGEGGPMARTSGTPG